MIPVTTMKATIGITITRSTLMGTLSSESDNRANSSYRQAIPTPIIGIYKGKEHLPLRRSKGIMDNNTKTNRTARSSVMTKFINISSWLWTNTITVLLLTILICRCSIPSIDTPCISGRPFVTFIIKTLTLCGIGCVYDFISAKSTLN